MTASDGVSRAEGGLADGGAVQPGAALRDVSHRVADQALDFAEQRKREGAERIDGVARAVHDAAEQIGRDLPQAADYIHDAAARLEAASALVRDRSLGDLAGMVDDFARRRPAAFFGGSVLAGFLLSRFLKSTNTRRAPSTPATSTPAASMPGPGADPGGRSH